MNNTWSVILAAGKGTRMKSSLPKVLHPLCGRPMLWFVLEAVQNLTCRQVVVVGHGSEEVRTTFGEDLLYVEQEEQLGTGHALMKSLPQLPEKGEVLVLCGDTPLLSEDLLQRFLNHHRQQGGAATVLTALLENPSGYGRLIRDEHGRVQEIVEEMHASSAQKQVREINTGSYCFDLAALKQHLPGLPKNEVKGEYYLTDLVPLLLKAGHGVDAFMLEGKESGYALGINDRLQLAEAASVLRQRINADLMIGGVTIIDPASTYIDAGVEVGVDTVIYPQTILEGETRVGEGCTLGPSSHLVHTLVGNGVHCRHSAVYESRLGDGSVIGPYAHIRPGSNIDRGAKIGDFVEVKNSYIGPSSKVPHLSYVGDAHIGAGVNVGAGCIVVNYDGVKKHQTTIEEEAFIGCNSNLVAPLTIGKGSFIAAGSTITRDVPAEALSLSRSKQEIKEGLARRFLKKKGE